MPKPEPPKKVPGLLWAFCASHPLTQPAAIRMRAARWAAGVTAPRPPGPQVIVIHKAAGSKVKLPKLSKSLSAYQVSARAALLRHSRAAAAVAAYFCYCCRCSPPSHPPSFPGAAPPAIPHSALPPAIPPGPLAPAPPPESRYLLQLFSKAIQPKTLEDYPDATLGERSKIVAEMWKEASQARNHLRCCQLCRAQP